MDSADRAGSTPEGEVTDASKGYLASNDVRGKLMQRTAEYKARLFLASSIHFFSNCNHDIIHKRKLSTDEISRAIFTYVRHLTKRDYDCLVKAVQETPLEYFRIVTQPQEASVFN